jgi:hypothetical protein
MSQHCHCEGAVGDCGNLNSYAIKTVYFLRSPARFAAYVRKEQMPVFRQTKCVFLGSEADLPFCHWRPQHIGAFVISTETQRSLCHFDRSAAEWRNLADNWADPSVRDQIPPLRKAAPHSGRNDKTHLCFFRRIIAVFLRRSGATQQSHVLRQRSSTCPFVIGDRSAA